MKSSTKSALDSISAVLFVILLIAAFIWISLFIESWRAEVWAERFHEWRPK